MISKILDITNKTGLHARPASMFIQKASQFKSKITIGRVNDTNRMDAKSVISMLSLGLIQGDRIEICAEGEDEKDVIESIAKVIKEQKVAE
mgnify:CR=1 FL=1